MEQQAYQWIVIGILVMVYALEKAIKLLSNNPKKYGERIATLEKGQELIEERLGKIEGKLNKK